MFPKRTQKVICIISLALLMSVVACGDTSYENNETEEANDADDVSDITSEQASEPIDNISDIQNTNAQDQSAAYITSEPIIGEWNFLYYTDANDGFFTSDDLTLNGYENDAGIYFSCGEQDYILGLPENYNISGQWCVDPYDYFTQTYAYAYLLYEESDGDIWAVIDSEENINTLQIFMKDASTTTLLVFERNEFKEPPITDTSNETSTQNSYMHHCEVDNCSKEGTKSYLGLSGETEWYCQEHYDEMMDIIAMMEEDVGSGTASKHTCESCSKEGTHSIVGISGQTEYYCTEHYNEMVDILEMLIGA